MIICSGIGEHDFRQAEDAARVIASSQSEIFDFLRQANIVDEGPMRQYYRSQPLPSIIHEEIHSNAVSERTLGKIFNNDY